MFGRVIRAATSFVAGSIVSAIVLFVVPKFLAIAKKNPEITDQSQGVQAISASAEWFIFAVLLSGVFMIIQGAIEEGSLGP